MKIDTEATRLIDNLLARPIAVHRIFIDITGSVKGGIMLSQAYSWSLEASAPGGWFPAKKKEWREDIRLSWTEQIAVRRKLRNLCDSEGNRVWEEKQVIGRWPTHFRLNHEALYRVMAEYVQKEESGEKVE